MRQRKNYYWILLLAIILIFNAGYLNAVVLLSFFNKAVSYMTGNFASIGISVSHGDYFSALRYLSIALAFLLGAIISGILIGRSQFDLHYRYGHALILQAILILLGTWLHNRTAFPELHPSEYLIALACGMQNAMTTTFSGAVIRTTHFTGVITDLGIQIGHWLRGEYYEIWRIQLFALSIFCFIMGSAVGVLGLQLLQSDSLYVSACITTLLAIGFQLYRWHHLRSE